MEVLVLGIPGLQIYNWRGRLQFFYGGLSVPHLMPCPSPQIKVGDIESSWKKTQRKYTSSFFLSSFDLSEYASCLEINVLQDGYELFVNSSMIESCG